MLCCNSILILYRGDDFRRAFSQLGELRSIVSKDVNILALTATTTPESFKIISDRLCLNEPVIIGIPPSPLNIKYNVEPLPKMTMLCETLSEGLQAKHNDFQRHWYFVTPFLNVHHFTEPWYPN